MKKKIVLMIISVMVLSIALVGCRSVVKDVTKDVLKPKDDIYQNINSIISSPENSSSYKSLPDKFTFIAMSTSEPFPLEIENENGEFVEGNYISASISRNTNDHFFIEVSDVDYNFDLFDIFELTTNDVSSIYWTEDGKRTEMASFKATEMKKYEPSEIEPVESDTIEVENSLYKGEFTFKDAQLTTDVFGHNIIVLYLDFKNTGDKDVSPDLSNFSFYQGDTILNNNIAASSSTELDPSALQISLMDKTYVGKTQYYYSILVPNIQENIEYDPNAPLEIEQYDDNFNTTFYWKIDTNTTGE